MSKIIKATFSMEVEALETVRAIALSTGTTIKAVVAQAIADLEARIGPENLEQYRVKYEKAKRASRQVF